MWGDLNLPTLFLGGKICQIIKSSKKESAVTKMESVR